ncbi:MAG TPA: S1/P1 nuclease [Sphingomonas sp.]|uniref:S1/P1 nuclease n=1 Tax=Sphingomonas sp. TaxID=28214 RepID=UPI002B67C5DE|nr:S1/P1 nuclease [Sphingomonas sp.]HMI19991.1 S1/P1 nuclease [Sphingomonas sp.]
MSRIAWCLAAYILIAATPARAWSNQGHMATGLIAYDLLAAHDPAAIAAIEALMVNHPDRARFDKALAGLEGAARQRRLFALIARWPDDVRATRYNHTHWHHELRVVTGWTAFRGPRLGEADHAVLHSMKLLRDANADPGRRAIALCWLLHVVGDMHQPLHAGHLMNGRFPLTDLAGTLGWVRRAPDAAPEKLHHFWDTAADRPGDELAGAEALAPTIERDLPPDPASTGHFKADYRGWVRESEQLAAAVAYRGAALNESHRPEGAPLLSPDYVADARAVSERRLGQAGRRLADLLAALFPAG